MRALTLFFFFFCFVILSTMSPEPQIAPFFYAFPTAAPAFPPELWQTALERLAIGRRSALQRSFPWRGQERAT